MENDIAMMIVCSTKQILHTKYQPIKNLKIKKSKKLNKKNITQTSTDTV